MKNINTIKINSRYVIYTDDWTVYDTKHGKDIPQYIFDFIRKINPNYCHNY
jgi:hypothetical protein